MIIVSTYIFCSKCKFDSCRLGGAATEEKTQSAEDESVCDSANSLVRQTRSRLSEPDGNTPTESVYDSASSQARLTRSRLSEPDGNTPTESLLSRHVSDMSNRLATLDSDTGSRNLEASDVSRNASDVSRNTSDSSLNSASGPTSGTPLVSRLRKEGRKSGLGAVKVEVKEERKDASDEEEGEEQDRRAATKALRMVRKEHRASDAREDAGLYIYIWGLYLKSITKYALI